MGFNDLELSERLLIARRGTAYLSQRLAELTDDELDGPTLLDGWTRRHLVAHIGTTPRPCAGFWIGLQQVSRPRCTHRPSSVARRSQREPR